MKIKITPRLERDLITSARKRRTSVEDLIIDILGSQMLVEMFLTKDDSEAIKAIYRKYIN